ncbi:NitT/TauT family transport system ATP-binding protein [Methylocapsa palsarum]|uniref:NitT/TauT family transport system ATP-binding protein n=1 Tax=Methylocapsa palsarum TaxID=1612308 RepID=A0A1I4C2V9_9HYPH|nr:NitT/TauT family transport system ATP-binding protein [Methylocapsa palsarum]
MFPFSSHHYQLRLWLAAGGIDPDADLRLMVTPPPFMAASLANGSIDGFCVGAPWNSVAAQAGAGRILHASREIVANCPEKVLALRAGFALANRPCVSALSAAIREAADWSADPAHLDALVELLVKAAITQQEWARISAALLRDILAPRSGASPLATLRLDREATRANRDHARWLFRQMVDAHQVVSLPENEAIALSVYRPDLGDAPAGPSVLPLDLDLSPGP